MAVTYEEAREIVRQEVGATWSGGRFCLDDRNILENDEMYVFNVGNWEYIVGRDQRYALEGGLPVVGKADGRLRWMSSAALAMDRTLRRRNNPEPTLNVPDQKDG